MPITMGGVEGADHRTADQAGIGVALRLPSRCRSIGSDLSDCKSGCAQAGYPTVKPQRPRTRVAPPDTPIYGTTPSLLPLDERRLYLPQ